MLVNLVLKRLGNSGPFLSFSYMILLFFFLSCQAPTSQTVEITSITFESFTRGFQRKITLTPTEITCSENGKITTRALSEDQWKRVLKPLQEIHLPDIAQLPPPTTRHQSDGARHSTFHITTTDHPSGWSTPTFDDEKAHKSLAEVMKEVIRLEKLCK
jgi:hypothetical protein